MLIITYYTSKHCSPDFLSGDVHEHCPWSMLCIVLVCFY
uniref:Uncharacterized protein n=1 Tax=Rhizophora mucronata TaxID=61149 RepID=A0A2P2PE12_RHIMU